MPSKTWTALGLASLLLLHPMGADVAAAATSPAPQPDDVSADVEAWGASLSLSSGPGERAFALAADQRAAQWASTPMNRSSGTYRSPASQADSLGFARSSTWALTGYGLFLLGSGGLLLTPYYLPMVTAALAPNADQATRDRLGVTYVLTALGSMVIGGAMVAVYNAATAGAKYGRTSGDGTDRVAGAVPLPIEER